MSRVLVYVSLVATLALGAHAEYKIGVFAIGDVAVPPANVPLAVFLPVGIDCYVLAALIAGRDVVRALLVLAVSIGGGGVYIGAEQNDSGKAVVGGAVGLLLVVVLWRVEELAKHDAAQRAAARAERDAAAELSSPVAPSPAPGEAQTTVPEAGGAPPADPPRGRSTTSRPASRRGTETPAGSRDPAAIGREYIAAEVAAGRRPTSAGMGRAIADERGVGMNNQARSDLWRELTQQPPAPSPAPLHAVPQDIPSPSREEASA